MAFARDIAATSAREWVVTLKSWRMSVVAAAGPLLAFFVLSVGLSSALGALVYRGATYSYLAFVMPGILASTAATGGLFVAIPLYNDRLTGELEALFALPIARSSIILGKLVVMTGRTLLQSSVILGAGYALLGITPVADGVAIAAALALGGVLTASFMFAYTVMAALTRGQETFSFLTSLLHPFVMFVSSVYYPVDRLPPLLKAFALVNPLTYGTTTIRDVLLGQPVHTAHLAVVGGFMLVSFGLASRLFPRFLDTHN